MCRSTPFIISIVVLFSWNVSCSYISSIGNIEMSISEMRIRDIIDYQHY